MSQKRIALLPAYEPTAALIELLRQLRDANLKAVVVDDGSGEGYVKIFEKASQYAKVLGYAENHGKGYALKTGFRYIEEHFGTDCIVVTLDADGQHKIPDAMKVCEAASRQKDALILGSRKLPYTIPLRSRFGNTVTRHVFAFFTGVRVRDTQTGLRAFHGSLLPVFLSVAGERYEYEMNVLLYCAKEKIPMREIEIETVYLDKQNSSSHFRALADSYLVYREILRFSAASLISFLIDYALYTLLSLLTNNLLISNISARVVSASVNYVVNRKMVFQSRENVIKSAAQYFLLAALILLGNTLLLELLVDILHWNRYLSKILVEIFFFCCSYLVQRGLIFKR